MVGCGVRTRQFIFHVPNPSTFHYSLRSVAQVEVARLHALKSEMRGKLIAEARETIVQLWEDTNASQSVRDAFEGLKTMDEDDFNDELLQKHDDEIAVLQARLDQMRPMLRMIEKREEVIAERTKYEEVRNGRSGGS